LNKIGQAGTRELTIGDDDRGALPVNEPGAQLIVVSSLHETSDQRISFIIQSSSPEISGVNDFQLLDQYAYGSLLNPISTWSGGGVPPTDRTRRNRGGPNRPPREEALREKEVHTHLVARTEEMIISVLHVDEARANLSRDTLKDLGGMFWSLLPTVGNNTSKEPALSFPPKLSSNMTDTLINLIVDI